MIFGVGTDIVLIRRIKNSKAFAQKILSASEMQLWEEKTSSKQQNFLAKQFACKEAVAKAIGTGFSNTIFPKDIEILRNSAGKPYINPQASLEEVFADLGIINSHVSIADEIDYVVAFVIIES
ncbi:MAG: holo-ACP synthase [Gammaproteobacteria bacterium]|tara:strand:+ start:453 stop:821 length:369 start_codon:yes stop_codon:yes gene_type:complete